MAEPTGPLRVLVVDDQPLVRTGFAVILDAERDIAVVGEAGDGEQAVALAVALVPDVIVMDVRMPGMDGIAATTAICAQTTARVLMLTTYDLDEYVYEALRAGASGFLLKTMRRQDLVDAVRVIAAGEALLAPSVTRRLIAEVVTRPRSEAGRMAPTAPATAARLPELSPRETDTLRQLARGLSNVEIAAELYVTEHTVKTHVSNLLAKLGGRLVLAFRAGEHPLPHRLDPDVYRAVPTTDQAIEWLQAAGFVDTRPETRPRMPAMVWLVARQDE